MLLELGADPRAEPVKPGLSAFAMVGCCNLKGLETRVGKRQRLATWYSCYEYHIN